MREERGRECRYAEYMIFGVSRGVRSLFFRCVFRMDFDVVAGLLNGGSAPCAGMAANSSSWGEVKRGTLGELGEVKRIRRGHETGTCACARQRVARHGNSLETEATAWKARQ